MMKILICLTEMRHYFYSLKLLPAFLLLNAPLLVADSLPETARAENLVEVTDSSERKDWSFMAGLYTWVPAIDGNVGLQGLTSYAHVGIDTVLKRLDMAYMGYFEARYQRWSLGVDAVYAEFSDRTSLTYGPLSTKAKLKLEQALVTVRAQYRVIDTESYTLDLSAGFRWTSLSSKADIHGRLDFTEEALKPYDLDWNNTIRQSRDWVDPLIGLRSVVNLSSDWYLDVSGDIGGFGVSSKLTWQAMGGIGYRFNKHLSALGGYRALGIDYDRNGLKLDTVSHGPLLALIVSF